MCVSEAAKHTHTLAQGLERRVLEHAPLLPLALKDLEDQVVGQPAPEERGAFLLAATPLVEPCRPLQQQAQRGRLAQPVQLRRHADEPELVDHRGLDGQPLVEQRTRAAQLVLLLGRLDSHVQLEEVVLVPALQ